MAKKVNKFMIIPLFIIITTTAFSQDKIYINEDLKAEPPTYSNSTPHIQTFMKRSDFNPSFTELHKYVEDKLTEIRIPQYKVYLRPLSLGMTEENVRQIWQFGTITDDAGLQERNANKTATSAIATVNYAIGVSLYFENNRLKGWRIYNQPRFTISKDAKVVNYQNLKKNESVPGLKESPAFDLPKYEPSPPPLSQLEVPHNSVQDPPMQQYVQQHQTENDLSDESLWHCYVVSVFCYCSSLCNLACRADRYFAE